MAHVILETDASMVKATLEGDDLLAITNGRCDH